MRLRRFLISEPMALLTLGAVTPRTQNAASRVEGSRQSLRVSSSCLEQAFEVKNLLEVLFWKYTPRRNTSMSPYALSQAARYLLAHVLH